MLQCHIFCRRAEEIHAGHFEIGLYVTRNFRKSPHTHLNFEMQEVSDEKLITMHNVGYNRDQMDIIMQVLLERGIRPENVTVPMIVSIISAYGKKPE
jgi:hypothetical protein